MIIHPDSKLKIIGLYSIRLNGYMTWICICICGKEILVREPDLRNQISCGCLNKHYQSKTRLYSIWHHIKQKCQNTFCIHYREWNILYPAWDKFILFRNWAISNGYNNIKRLVTKDGFNPSNCIWITKPMRKVKIDDEE